MAGQKVLEQQEMFVALEDENSLVSAIIKYTMMKKARRTLGVDVWRKVKCPQLMMKLLFFGNKS